MLKKIFLLLCLSATLSSLFAEETEEPSPIKTKYLFVLYDAGETLALKGVMEKLQQTQEDFKVLVMGTSSDLIKKEDFAEHRLELADLGIEEKVDKAWPREKALSQDEIQKISARVNAAKIVTGVASEIQGQILDAFKANAKTLAYWDNFNPRGASPYFEMAKKVQERASCVMFPSFFVASSAEFEKRGLVSKRIVGQPTLEQWKKEVESVSKEEILKKLGIRPEKKIITFIGGYGENYQKAYSLFVKSYKGLQTKAKVIVQAHPKADGKWEQEYAQKKDASFIFPAGEQKISTIEAVSVADWVVCYDSTVGFQALSLGKNVIFVIPEKDPLRNIAIDLNLAKKASTVEEFAKAIEESSEKKMQKDFFSTFGIPKNSVEMVLSVLKEP